jgi:hypothetical protein
MTFRTALTPLGAEQRDARLHHTIDLGCRHEVRIGSRGLARRNHHGEAIPSSQGHQRVSDIYCTDGGLGHLVQASEGTTSRRVRAVQGRLSSIACSPMLVVGYQTRMTF